MLATYRLFFIYNFKTFVFSVYLLLFSEWGRVAVVNQCCWCTWHAHPLAETGVWVRLGLSQSHHSEAELVDTVLHVALLRVHQLLARPTQVVVVYNYCLINPTCNTPVIVVFVTKHVTMWLNPSIWQLLPKGQTPWETLFNLVYNGTPFAIKTHNNHFLSVSNLFATEFQHVISTAQRKQRKKKNTCCSW